MRSKSKHWDQDERSERAQKRPTTASKRTKPQALGRARGVRVAFFCVRKGCVKVKYSGATRARSLCFILEHNLKRLKPISCPCGDVLLGNYLKFARGHMLVERQCVTNFLVSRKRQSDFLKLVHSSTESKAGAGPGQIMRMRELAQKALSAEAS